MNASCLGGVILHKHININNYIWGQCLKTKKLYIRIYENIYIYMAVGVIQNLFPLPFVGIHPNDFRKRQKKKKGMKFHFQ